MTRTPLVLQRVCRCDHGRDCVCTEDELDWDSSLDGTDEWRVCRCADLCFCTGIDVREGLARRKEKKSGYDTVL